MAAMIEGKPASEFFKDAAQRQKRSNAYATYTPPEPKKEERKEGRIPEIKAASPAPMRSEPAKAAAPAKEAPKPTQSAKPAPAKPAEPTKNARQLLLERTYKEAQEIGKAAKERQTALAKKATDNEAARQRNIAAAKEEVRQSKPTFVKAGDATIKAVGDTAAGISDSIGSAASSLSDLTKRFVVGDSERKKRARERLRKAQEL